MEDKMKTRTIILILFVVAVFTSSSATIINIPDDYSTIQQGIDASVDGDTVLAQPGTYVENINFNGHNIVLGSLFLTTGDTSYISSTIIDGNASGSVINIGSGEDSTTVVTGFTIQNGYIVNYDGGSGIYCNGSNPAINNNTITGNYAVRGGGIYCYSSNPTISSNGINGNSGQDGGGIYCLESNPMINDNTITGNFATLLGGGIYCYSSSPTISSNAISGNSAGSVYGGGLYCSNDSDPTVINTILWDNSASEGPQIYGEPYVSYCDIEGGREGEGNIDIDPLFRDPENGDFHLMAIECGDSVDSPCIDAGHPDILDSLLDCAWGLGTILSDMGTYGGGDSAGVGVDDLIKQLPKRFTLSQNYPNPFNVSTVIRYNLPEPSAVTINIYDILGRKVQTLIDKYQSAGHHQVIWQADEFSSGIYFYKLTAGDFENTKKMVLLK